MERLDQPKKTASWNSVDDALQVFYSLSKVTGGSTPISSKGYLPCGLSRESSEIPVENSSGPFYQRTSNEGVEESYYGSGGRGKKLRELEKQYSRQHLDDKIHADLRLVTGPGYSNELIEHYFGSGSSSTNGGETGTFSDCDEDTTRESPLSVECVVSDSSIMKKIKESQCHPPTKKKPPRCRNAIVLSLTQKNVPEEFGKETKNLSPILKGPDLFLSNRSYSSTLSSANKSNSNSGSSKPMFTDEDFPAL